MARSAGITANAGVSRCKYRHLDVARRDLPKREEDVGAVRFHHERSREVSVQDILDDPDDLDLVGPVRPQSHPLSHRSLTRVHPGGHRRRDNDHSRRPVDVVRVEEAPLGQLHAERCEVIARHGVAMIPDPRVFTLTLSKDVARREAASERQVRCKCSTRDAGERRKLPLQLRGERPDGFVRIVAPPWEPDAKRLHALDLGAGVDGELCSKAPGQEAGAHHQNEREGHLCDDEHMLRA